MRTVLKRNIRYTKYLQQEQQSMEEYTKNLEQGFQQTIKNFKDLVFKNNLANQVNLQDIENQEKSIIGLKNKDENQYKAD